MYIEDLHLPWENVLIEDYYQRFDSSFVSTVFTYNPWSKESFHRRYQFLQKNRVEPFSRRELIKVIRSQYGQQRLHPQVELNLRRFEDERSCVVIGGQQAGLLTGPLYTLYKAVTIIQLAQREEERLGVPVIPIFWIAGEDHDFEEVNHIWIRDTKGQIRKQSVDRSFTNELYRAPVSSLPMNRTKMLIWLEELGNRLPDTLYKNEWMQRCEKVLASVQTWGQFFRRMMQGLFDQWGLLLIDSNHQELRRLETKCFLQLIHQNQSLQERIFQTAQSCQQHQYPNPVKLIEHHAHLFIHLHNERYPLFHQRDRWMTRDGKHQWTTDELLTIAEEEPQRLSNNVLTRPLMQEYLFPTLAFVGGRTEIAYWSLLKQAFSLINLEMPIVFPRPQITLVDSTSVKRARQFQLTFEDLFFHYEEKKNQWLKQKGLIDVERLFQQTDEEMIALHRALIQQLEQQLKIEIGDIGRKNWKRIQSQLRYLYRYVQRTIEEKHQTELRRMDELLVRVYPLQKLQERVYNLIQIWNEHGCHWLNRLVQQERILEPVSHHLVYI